MVIILALFKCLCSTVDNYRKYLYKGLPTYINCSNCMQIGWITWITWIKRLLANHSFLEDWKMLNFSLPFFSADLISIIITGQIYPSG